MKLLNYRKKKSLLGDLIYYTFNLILAIFSLILVLVTNSFLPSLLLVLLSKWRVFAVRPRFWSANIKANLVDFIASLSIVSLIYHHSGNLSLQIILTTIYALWLTIVKPLVSSKGTILQSAFALFFASLSVFTLLYDLDVFFIIVIFWLVGYAVSRHVLVSYEENDIGLLAVVYAFFISEVVWVNYFWVNSYRIPFVNLDIPQVVLILLFVTIPVVAIYTKCRRKNFRVAVKESLPSIVFPFAMIVFLLLAEIFR